MKKHVHSKDPRKAKVVEAMKFRSGATRISRLVEITHPGSSVASHYFIGTGLKYNKQTGFYWSLGDVMVTAVEAGVNDEQE